MQRSRRQARYARIGDRCDTAKKPHAMVPSESSPQKLFFQRCSDGVFEGSTSALLTIAERATEGENMRSTLLVSDAIEAAAL